MLGENLVEKICLDVRLVKWKQTKKSTAACTRKVFFIQVTFPRHHLQ